MRQLFRNAGADLPAALVVFLVALPLCLGVAQASGAPLFSGIIAGVVGGIIVGALSGSPLSVSGPAAGLTAIVATAVADLPSFNVFLLAVVLAGAMQILLGYIKAGIIGDFVPNAVIKGMLAAIGLILILKEIPHLLGYDADFMGDESFAQKDKANTFTEIPNAFRHPNPLAIVIGLVSLAILLMWETKLFKSRPIFRLLPAPLFVVVVGTGINLLMQQTGDMAALSGDHLVSLPVAKSIKEFAGFFVLPDFSALLNVKMLKVAFTIAVVASLESLLSIEAVDKLDSFKRITDTNRELRAQGVGNIVSGLLGGLPVTSVIVRSSANVNSGAKSKLSAIVHGMLLMVSAIFVARYLNMIPMAALAAILIFTGYKLAKPSVFQAFFKKGYDQFLPFVVTIIAILFSDLLKGIIVGMLVGFFFLIRSNFRSSVFVVNDKNRFLFRLRKDVSFLNKSLIKNKLSAIPDLSYVIIDATRADFIDKDVIEEINNFIEGAPSKNITVEVKRSLHKPMHLLFSQPGQPNIAFSYKPEGSFNFTPIDSDH
jgi:MFS superfamily sulfate permease-like transporter